MEPTATGNTAWKIEMRLVHSTVPKKKKICLSTSHQRELMLSWSHRSVFMPGCGARGVAVDVEGRRSREEGETQADVNFSSDTASVRRKQEVALFWQEG